MRRETERQQVERVRKAGEQWIGYPCTILKDRYGGSYSGAAWTAWPLGPDEIPDGPLGGDSECDIFWDMFQKTRALVGLGSTPDRAKADLYEKAKLA